MIKQLCMFSIICGAAEFLCPEGAVKAILKIVCPTAIIVTMLLGISEIPIGDYAVDMAKYRALENEIIQNASEQSRELDRSVIAAECETYIKDKAQDQGCIVTQISVSLTWSRDGFWVPSYLSGRAQNQRSVNTASEIAFAELGIPYSEQEWIIDGSEE